MARMSWEERQARREARWYGVRCVRAIQHAVFHQREADAWRALDAGDAEKDDTLIRMWQDRSDLSLQDAVSYARSAAHHARRSQPDRP